MNNVVADVPVRPKRKRLRIKDFDYSDPNYVYFITVCARHLANPFNNHELAGEIIDALISYRDQLGFSLYCYCLMPDHLHLAISPSLQSGSISKILQGFKSYTTRIAWKYNIKGKLWQRSFHDHIGRKRENIFKICQYILTNPIRKGLAERIEDCKYSGLLDPLPM